MSKFIPSVYSSHKSNKEYKKIGCSDQRLSKDVIR